jgi:hypothetical protein
MQLTQLEWFDYDIRNKGAWGNNRVISIPLLTPKDGSRRAGVGCWMLEDVDDPQWGDAWNPRPMSYRPSNNARHKSRRWVNIGAPLAFECYEFYTTFRDETKQFRGIVAVKD